jgi:hypothetical protein
MLLLLLMFFFVEKNLLSYFYVHLAANSMLRNKKEVPFLIKD